MSDDTRGTKPTGHSDEATTTPARIAAWVEEFNCPDAEATIHEIVLAKLFAQAKLAVVKDFAAWLPDALTEDLRCLFVSASEVGTLGVYIGEDITPAPFTVNFSLRQVLVEWIDTPDDATAWAAHLRQIADELEAE